MPRGSKVAYTDKQKRQAEHIEDSYKARGVDDDEAAALAWATVNKESGRGRKAGSGRAAATRGGTRKTAS
jgi:plasmid stabilization system protein ParE